MTPEQWKEHCEHARQLGLMLELARQTVKPQVLAERESEKLEQGLMQFRMGNDSKGGSL